MTEVLFLRSFPQILIKGHLALRVQKMASRAEYSKYLFMPTTFCFRKVVRVTASIFKYLKKTGLVKKSDDRFRIFVIQNLKENLQSKQQILDHFVKEDQFMGICWGSEKPLTNFKGNA
jgi:hypothetical protein